MREEVVGIVKGKLKLNRKFIGLFKNQYGLAKGLQASSQTNLAHASDSSINGHMEHFLTSLTDTVSICNC